MRLTLASMYVRPPWEETLNQSQPMAESHRYDLPVDKVISGNLGQMKNW